MSAQHTPGPWWVRTRAGHDEKIVDCFVAAKDVNGFAYDAEIMGDDEYRDDIERKLADANLIASAPDLVLERDALKARVAELQRELSTRKVELSRLRSILYDQNERLESQLASLREWRRVASQKIDQSDPSAVACFISEVVSASLMYNGSTGPSVGVTG